MLRFALIVTPLALVTAIACGDSGSDDSGTNTTGGSSSSAAGETNQPAGGESTGTNTGGSSSTGGKSSSSNGGAPSDNGGAPSDVTGGAGMSGTMGGAETNPGAAGAGGAAACADVFGDYAIKTAAGMCGTLNKGAAQAIDGNDSACVAHFVSAPAKGDPAINGAVDLDAKGDFKDVKLKLGTEERNPCSGTYNALAQTMTVKCGGVGDLCTIVMTKK